MPAAGWAAESGDPVLFVSASGRPGRHPPGAARPPAARTSTCSGPPSVIRDALLGQLRKYGTVKRVGASDPAANSVAFAEYRDPACAYGQPCVARARQLRLGDAQPRPRLRAAQRRSARSTPPRPRRCRASGSFGPQLLVDNASTLPTLGAQLLPRLRHPRLHPGGPDRRRLQPRLDDRRPERDLGAVQAEVDNLLEAVRRPAMSQAEHPDRLRAEHRSPSRTCAS